MGKRIVEAGERLSRETGIDFKKYYKPELVMKIGELIGSLSSSRWLIFKYFTLMTLILTALCIRFHLQAVNPYGIVVFFCFGILFNACLATGLGIQRFGLYRKPGGPTGTGRFHVPDAHGCQGDNPGWRAGFCG